MYENLSQEELEYVLEAGLEKVAYEEGVNEYVNSLEKVASVHNIDAEELHDFLEKNAAEDEKEKPSLKEQVKYRGEGALRGAGQGAIGGAFAGALGDRIVNSLSKGETTPTNLKAMAALSGGLGGLTGAINPKLTNVDASHNLKNPKEKKQKTAAAYGLDEETFDYLVENGIEALTN